MVFIDSSESDFHPMQEYYPNIQSNIIIYSKYRNKNRNVCLKRISVTDLFSIVFTLGDTVKMKRRSNFLLYSRNDLQNLIQAI